eukprot:scaffold32638_cov112-Isochrysis_galbana.AAC.6
MPLARAPIVALGRSFRLIAQSNPPGLSPARTEFAALCIATSPDEHAVSMLRHGPWSPNTNERRPLATEMVSAVARYTDGPGSDGREALYRAQSGRSMPRKTPNARPSRPLRLKPELWSAAYPISKSTLCCGSMLPASDMEIANDKWSNASTFAKKPPYRMTSRLVESSISTSREAPHLAKGTTPTASPAAISKPCRLARKALPPGHREPPPSSDT